MFSNLMGERARRNGVNLIRDFDLSIDKCYLDQNDLHRSLLNLVTNAIDACIFDQDKEKKWSVVMKTRKEDSRIRFDIVDNGMGMTKEVQENLFERFFSTKGSKGSGFGLIVTRKIIEEQGGAITFESDPKRGTTFTLFMPCTSPAED